MSGRIDALYEVRDFVKQQREGYLDSLTRIVAKQTEYGRGLYETLGAAAERVIAREVFGIDCQWEEGAHQLYLTMKKRVELSRMKRQPQLLAEIISIIAAREKMI